MIGPAGDCLARTMKLVGVDPPAPFAHDNVTVFPLTTGAFIVGAVAPITNVAVLDAGPWPPALMAETVRLYDPAGNPGADTVVPGPSGKTPEMGPATLAT